MKREARRLIARWRRARRVQYNATSLTRSSNCKRGYAHRGSRKAARRVCFIHSVLHTFLKLVFGYAFHINKTRLWWKNWSGCQILDGFWKFCSTWIAKYGIGSDGPKIPQKLLKMSLRTLNTLLWIIFCRRYLYSLKTNKTGILNFSLCLTYGRG